MISLDTNAILAVLLTDRPIQKAAVTKLLATQNCQIADMVFAEAAFVMLSEYSFSREDIATSFRIIANINSVNCNKMLLAKALPLFEARPSLSFVDCCLVTYADINGATPLYTSDKKLVNQSNGLAKLI